MLKRKHVVIMEEDRLRMPVRPYAKKEEVSSVNQIRPEYQGLERHTVECREVIRWNDYNHSLVCRSETSKLGRHNEY